MEVFIVLAAILLGATVGIELLWIGLKRLSLIVKLKKACKKNGFKAKFKRFPLLSVYLFKGRLDLTVESGIYKYAVSILTSRHRSGSFVFFEDRVEIWKRRKLTIHRVSMGRNGFVVNGRSISFQGGMARKGKIKLHFSKIAGDYPLHSGICIINPAPSSVFISYGTTLTEIHDGDRIHSGFTVYGASGFIRKLSNDFDVFGI